MTVVGAGVLHLDKSWGDGYYHAFAQRHVQSMVDGYPYKVEVVGSSPTVPTMAV